jgi:hypothetical protein
VSLEHLRPFPFSEITTIKTRMYILEYTKRSILSLLRHPHLPASPSTLLYPAPSYSMTPHCTGHKCAPLKEAPPPNPPSTTYTPSLHRQVESKKCPGIPATLAAPQDGESAQCIGRGRQATTHTCPYYQGRKQTNGKHLSKHRLTKHAAPGSLRHLPSEEANMTLSCTIPR